VFRNKIRAATAGIALFAVAIGGLGPAGGGVGEYGHDSSARWPITCSLQTSNGYYLTAVGGGGRNTDVIHSDATRIGSWEQFRLNCTH
jgi:hypothetical protein